MTGKHRVGFLGTVVVASVLLCLAPEPRKIRAVDPAKDVVAALTAKELLDHIDKGLQDRIAQAQAGTRDEILRAAGEVRQLAQLVDALLGEQRAKLFQDLSSERQAWLLGLSDLAGKIEKPVSEFRNSLETVALNLNRAIPSSLGGGNITFRVARAEGLTQFRHRKDEYSLFLRGVGFGTNDNEYSYEPELLVDGKVLPAVRFRPLNSNDLDVGIPAAFMNARFATDKVTYLDVTLRSKITAKTSLAKAVQEAMPILKLVIPERKAAVESARLDIKLLPTEPGEIQIDETIVSGRLADTIHTHTITTSVSELINRRQPPFEVKETWTAPAGAQIVDVRYECPTGKEVEYTEEIEVAPARRDNPRRTRTEKKIGYESAGEILNCTFREVLDSVA